MKLLIIGLSLASMTCFGARNTCSFPNGEAKISYKGKTKAHVKVKIDGKGPTYRNCQVSEDELGKLIDCNTGNRDFMILISKGSRPRTGGIMSNTLDLFEDINC